VDLLFLLGVTESRGWRAGTCWRGVAGYRDVNAV